MKLDLDDQSRDLWDRAFAIYKVSLPEGEKGKAEQCAALITRVSKNDDTFILFTGNPFSAKVIKEELTNIHQGLTFAGAPIGTTVQVDIDQNAEQSEIVPQIIKQEPVSHPQGNLTHIVDSAAYAHVQQKTFLPLDPTYTFDSFVQGPSNSWAFASAQGVAKNPGAKGSNPFFLHGGTGLGKTHLIQAIGHSILQNSPNMRIGYLTAEMFLNEYILALSNKTMEEFRQLFRHYDVLLIDDIQFLQRGEMCQEEFFNTFNHLISLQKQIVLTSDVSPKKLTKLQERLISRFEGGMVQEVEMPGPETRIAILKKKAEKILPNISNSVLEFLALHIDSNVRTMEGALFKVVVAMQMKHTNTLEEEELRFLLKDIIDKEKSMKKLTVKEIIEVVASKYDVTTKQILSNERTQTLVTPRQLAMFIARKLVHGGVKDIAKGFEKSHATLIHGVKTIEDRLETEDNLRQTLKTILAEFNCTLSDVMQNQEKA